MDAFSRLESVETWSSLAERVLGGHAVTREEALAILRAPDADVLALLQAAFRLRSRFFGRKVHLYRLMNIQSGLCQEDCHYCSQSRLSTAPIDVYPMKPAAAILAQAAEAKRLGASTFCMVASGRGPSDQDVDYVCDVVGRIKAEHELHVCVCMGLLAEGQAERFKAAGVDRYNHNLNASESFTPRMVTTHSFRDRVETVERVRSAGISPCSGALFGLGESDEDRVDVALALREVGSESIPCNFLHAIPGTPFSGVSKLTPAACLKILAMMRFVHPDKEIRIAGGREVQLGALQPLGLYAANSIFVNGYLTTPGQGAERDLKMIADLGFEVDSTPLRGG